MITEAQRCGLKFKSDAVPPPAVPADPDTFKNAISKRDKDGRLYDPRKGLGGYYRYGPRKLVEPALLPGVEKREDDEVSGRAAEDSRKVFRRIENSRSRLCAGWASARLRRRQGRRRDRHAGSIWLRDHHAVKARAHTQEHVWNEVWIRRLVYFATVGATLGLVMFPARQRPANVR